MNRTDSMTGDDPTGHFSLRTVVPAAIAVWAAAFWFVYGPMVLAYLLFHAATTGVFLIAIRRADRKRLRRQTVSRTVHVAHEPSAERRRPAAKQVVAS